MGDLAIDWSSMVVKDGEDVSWKNPYDWSFLKLEARERRRGRDRERRGGGGSGSTGGGAGEDDIGGGGSASSCSASSSRPNPRGKRKVANKKKETERESGKRGAAKVVVQNTADIANQAGEEVLPGIAGTSANAKPLAGGKENSAAGFGSPGVVETISSSPGAVDNGDCSAGSVGVVENKVLGENNVPSSTPAGTSVKGAAQPGNGTNPAAANDSEKRKEDGGSDPSRYVEQGHGSGGGTSVSDDCRSGLVGALEKEKDYAPPLFDEVKPSVETGTVLGDPVGETKKEVAVRKATDSLERASGASKHDFLLGPDSSNSLATTRGSSDVVTKVVVAGPVGVADQGAMAAMKEEQRAASLQLRSAAEAVEAVVVEKAVVPEGKVDGSGAVTVANGVVTGLVSKEADLAGGVGEEKGGDNGVAGGSEGKIGAQGKGVTASPKEGRMEGKHDIIGAKEEPDDVKGLIAIKGPAADSTALDAAAAVAASPSVSKGEAKGEGVSQVRFLGCVTVCQIGL